MSAYRSPQTEADGLVEVRLSDVPEKTRCLVAERIIRLQEITGTQAIELRMAAIFPRQDPSLLVTTELAARVCGWPG